MIECINENNNNNNKNELKLLNKSFVSSILPSEMEAVVSTSL